MPAIDIVSGGSASRAIAIAAFLAFACSSRVDEPLCAGTAEEAIVNGTTDESYLGLAERQIRAVVRVRDAMQTEGAMCTGTLVSPEWVLTAGHCLQSRAAEVVISAGGGAPISAPAVERLAHPDLDIALLRVEPAAVDPAAIDVQPIGVATPNVPRLAESDRVEMAGYGRTELGTLGELRFVVESIVQVSDNVFRVSGRGASGACEGDSGGPLLVREPDGSAVVAGVLAGGAASCLGQDAYVRLDTLRDWISERTGAYAAETSDCGTIGDRGRCLYGAALWCAEGRLAAEQCPSGAQCGWSNGALGFRCVDRSSDPCRGADEFGVCDGDESYLCSRGTLEQSRCAACGQACVYDRTGKAGCAQSPDAQL